MSNYRIAVNSKAFAVVVASVVSATGGAAGAYLVLNRRLSRKYHEYYEEQLEESRRFFAKVNKTDESSDLSALAAQYDEDVTDPEEPGYSTAADALSAASEISESMGYVSYNDPSPKKGAEPVAPKTSNVFARYQPPVDVVEDYDLQAEMAKREAGRPYVVDRVSFYETDNDRMSRALTYFEKDDVLIDESDSVISNVDSLVGVDNLKFGYGSGDKDTVLIFDDRTNEAIEIHRSRGSYSEEVLGLSEEDYTPEYEDRTGIRKMRDRD